MRSHQQKFLADVEAAAKFYGMEMVVDQVYGNTGWVSITFEDDYEPLTRFYYEFQSGNNADTTRIEIEGIPNPKRAHLMRNGKPDDGVQGRKWWYMSPDELPVVIKAIRNEMAAAANKRRQAEIEGFDK